MQTILLAVQVIVAIALIVTVLFQRSDADGFGMGSGSAGGMGMLSGRAQANFFTRLTGILAAIFMINSLLLTILVAQDGKNTLVDKISATPVEGAPVNKALPAEGKNLATGAPKADVKKVDKPSDKPAEKSVPKAK